jgi:hypothetical protein
LRNDVLKSLNGTAVLDELVSETPQVTGDGPGTETFARDALAADARFLVEQVEAHHPEPYHGYDGRVALHERLERLVADLPERATAEAFYRDAAGLVAGLKDAHSRLEAPHDGDDDRRLPLSFRVVGDGLYVDSVADDAHRHLLGARLAAVEGVDVATLADRVAGLYGVENDYHGLSWTGRMVAARDPLARLLDDEVPTAPELTLEAPDGTTRTVALAPVAEDADPVAAPDATFPQPAGDGPRYRLYEDGDAALFVPGDLQGYRESFEAALATGADFARELAPAAYERHVGGDPPDDVEAMVAELPSMAETVVAAAEAMAASDASTLVVDLRDNPGGDSTFVFHLAYALYGYGGVDDLDGTVRALKRRTEAHRERFGADDPGTADANPADYDLSGLLGEGEEDARERLQRSETFAALADRTDGPVYEPERVVVVTSARTMSSAFAGAAQLSTLGADVVGVPSGQAPRSFGEAVEFELPTTGLELSVAGAMYDWVPDPDGDVLAPDRELTPAAFDRYDRAADAGLRLAFDHAGVTDGDPPTPVEEE